jgi:PRTRC genetic system protein E
MFNELKQMLRKGDHVTVTIAIEDDTQLRVNVFPKLFTTDGENGPNRTALNTPLSIIGTPEELDSPTFLQNLTQFTDSTNALRNTLEEVEAAHKTAAEAAKTAGAARIKAKPGTKPGATSAAGSAKADPTPTPAAPTSPDDNTEELGL